MPYADKVKQIASASNRVTSFRRRAKETLVEEFGGKCQDCGYSKCLAVLQFHHIDPSTKEFQIGGVSFSMKRIREEAQKCVLLCANCHAERHYIAL